MLVVAQPTWGVDAGAAAAIRQALLDLADKGAAVLVISQDLDELFAICDRIAVICRRPSLAGPPVGRRSPSRSIGLLMGGAPRPRRERGGPCAFRLEARGQHSALWACALAGARDRR